MVKSFPFEGIFYNKKKIKKIDNVVAPPYDVISPEQQDALYNLHEYNIIKLILGKTFPEDTNYNNKYTRAASYFRGLLKHEILIKDEKPCIYVYEQRFKAKNKNFVRIGFLALLRLEDMGKGKVFPHEETFSKPKVDRLELLRQCNANFESIFSIYHDEKEKINKFLKKFTKRKPLLEAKDQDKTIHRIWKINSKAAIHRIMREMKDKWLFIADGHHRYESSIKFREEMKTKTSKFSEEDSYNHMLMYFTPIEGKGLVVLPIHRAVQVSDPLFDPILFVQELTEHFEITEIPFKPKALKQARKKFLRQIEKEGQQSHVFGMYMAGEKNKFYILKLKDTSMVDDFVPENKPKQWKHLDVTILHSLIIERLLDIKRGDPESASSIKYIKDADLALEEMNKGKYQITFILNATKVEDIIHIAGKYEKMPQKSTYFYPKLASGLILREIENNQKIEY